MSTAGYREILADYKLPDGTVRALVAQRIDGRVALTDTPVADDGDGRVYLVERHVTSLAELDALTDAYVEHSRHAGMPAVLAQRRAMDDLADAA